MLIKFKFKKKINLNFSIFKKYNIIFKLIMINIKIQFDYY